DRLLPGNQRQIGGGRFHLLAVGDTLADAHIDDDLVEDWNLLAVLVAELRGKLAADNLLELDLQPRRHARLGLARRSRLGGFAALAVGRGLVTLLGLCRLG